MGEALVEIVLFDDLAGAEELSKLGQGHVDRPDLLEDVGGDHDREPQNLASAHSPPFDWLKTADLTPSLRTGVTPVPPCSASERPRSILCPPRPPGVGSGYSGRHHGPLEGRCRPHLLLAVLGD